MFEQICNNMDDHSTGKVTMPRSSTMYILLYPLFQSLLHSSRPNVDDINTSKSYDTLQPPIQLKELILFQRYVILRNDCNAFYPTLSLTQRANACR
jgi:hypothetical protein